MDFDPMKAMMDVSGEDPFVGATSLSVPPQGLSGLSPQGKQVIMDLSQLQRLQRQRQLDVTDARIDRISKIGELPTTLISVDSQVNIAAGAQLGIAFQTFNNVRITDFTIQAAGAPLFLLLGIQIGRLNLFQNNGAIPADRFQPNSKRPPIETPELPAGTQGVVTVQNIGAAAARFVGVFDALDLTMRSPDCGR